MSFKVNYFDGKSSKTQKATVSPNSLGWKITYVNDIGNQINISWDINAIKKSEVYTKGFVSFTYGKFFPFQKIESNNTSFIDYINNSHQKNLTNKVDTFLHGSLKKSLLILLFILVSIGSGVYFYAIPTVATSFVKNLSKKNVIDFGDYVFSILSTDLEINDDASKHLQNFVDVLKIDAVFPIKTYVVESKQLNAFALSGGKIVVYSNLLKKIENEAQLTALIAHEISHIENRHVLKNVARNLSGAIFISALFGDVSGVTAVMADNAHMFSQLSYTRDLEKEADVFGLKVMKKNAIDQNGMPQLFKILKKESLIDVPTFLSNHPMLKDRILYSQKIADKQTNIVENKLLKEKWKILKASLIQTPQKESTND